MTTPSAMSTGRSIRLFLVDGNPQGLLTAEVVNWTGHVLTGPRSLLAKLVQRPECARTGLYFLVGPDPDQPALTRVYVGESDDMAVRLKQHSRAEDKGFWERVCLVSSKDQNLTKAHVKYLESALIQMAGQSGRCVLANGTAPQYLALPESDRADMAYFIEQIRVVLPVLGFEFLRDAAATRQAVPPSAAPATSFPRFELSIPRFGIQASAEERDGEFVVLTNSKARGTWVGTAGGYQSLYQQLVASGVLAPSVEASDLRRFTTDYAFASPSAAATVVSGRSTNGRGEWRTPAGQTYGNWQDEQVAAHMPPQEHDAV